jgi:hypothetical protein
VITVIVCLLLDEWSRLLLKGRLRKVTAVAGLCAVLAAHLAVHQPIDHHEAAHREMDSVLATIDFLTRQAPAGGDVCIHNQPFQWIGGFLAKNPTSFPGWAAVFAIAYPGNTIHGRTVHFIETNPRVLLAAHAKPQKRLAGLLVAPDRLPPRCRVF